MANIKSAEKRIRQTIKQQARNRAKRSRMRTAIKQLRGVISSGDKKKARELLPGALRLIDRTAQRKVVHRNAAARSKSRLVAAVSKMA